MTDKELESLRHKMNDVTIDMLDLFLERAKIASEIGRVKKEIGANITDTTRESQLHNDMLQRCKERNNNDDVVNGMTMQQTEQIITKFLNYLIRESINIQSINIQSSNIQSSNMSSACISSTGNNECCGDNVAAHLSIFAQAKELEKSGNDIIHMEVGEPNFAPPHTVKQALAESYDLGHTKYGNSQGMPELLYKLASYASKKFNPAIELSDKNVIVTPGGRFAVFAAMSALLKPGDNVLIIRPAWPAYENCAVYLGAQIRAIDTTIQDSWMPQLSQIQDAINNNTKMIILNYPNNPTGKILPAYLLDQIINMAKEHNMYVLSDEIYADYVISGKPQKSVISYEYDKCIAVQSFSKSHAMTGFRVGYAMAHDKKIIDRIKSLSSLCLTSVSSPMQYAALKALNGDVTSNVNTINDRLRMLIQEVKKQANLEFVNPDGGMYLFVRMPTSDTSEFAQELLKNDMVAIAPGMGFGGAYGNYIRISVACEDVQRLSKGINKLKNKINQE